MILNLELDTTTEKKVNMIFNNTKNRSVIIEEFIEYRINQIKQGIINIKKDLIEYEKKYNITSFDLFNNNIEFDRHSDDYIIWSGIYEMYNQNIEKLKELE